MRQAGVSSIGVTEQGRLIGLVTIRDMSNRVVAEGLDTRLPVSEVMTAHPAAAAWYTFVGTTSWALSVVPTIPRLMSCRATSPGRSSAVTQPSHVTLGFEAAAARQAA